MSQRTVPDLKEIFKQAAEIAQQAPENLQETAFSKAVDLLTGNAQQEPVITPAGQVPKKKSKPTKRTDANSGVSSTDRLIDEINSTQHPGVKSASSVLDRSLMVLQIALTEHDVDGLTPTEIATILTEKFRIRTTRTAVNMALGRATSLVDRRPQGRGFLYRIMGPGEEYLAHQDGPSDSSIHSNRRGKPRKKRINRKVTSPTDGGSAKEVHKPKRHSKNSTKDTSQKKSQKDRAGPKATVLSLIDSDFFSKPRTGPEIQGYLKTKRGFNFGTDSLRMVMLRLVRDEKLERDLNAEGEYEYKIPKA